jgi:cholesterol oxidase
MSYDFDFVIIGSGFGGSVSALRTTEKGYRVAVIEQGRRWSESSLPRSTWQLHKWLWLPVLGTHGFFGMRFFRHLVVLHGNAVGGGSITYANTLLAPPDSVWIQGSWAGLCDWQNVMPQHYAVARRMLGVTTNPWLGPADLRLKQMAQLAGVERSFYPTEVGVYFGAPNDPPGTTVSDPFFDGEGPDRTSCTRCGGCMVGCRFGAKNSLDKNYLYLAEKKGAQIFPETRAIDIRPLDVEDGSAGYEIHTAAVTASGHARRFTCRGVIFAASSLGTQDLLFRLKTRKSLPRISDALGKGVRTNAESLIGIRFPGSKEDLSRGIAIGSGVYIDEYTHIEATRYPDGSNTMALLCTVMTAGHSGMLRVLMWLLTLVKMFCMRPWTTLRILVPFRWARETMILLCMQTVDGQLTMKLKRRWFWPFSMRISTQGDKVPTFIPSANEFARKVAAATGSIPMTSLTEILFDIPMTAHCIGGACMGHGRAHGVCDGKNRVFGYRNMYVCDGSVLSANLGVNPSLTIAALTEHAMSHIVPASQQTWDAIGEEVS